MQNLPVKFYGVNGSIWKGSAEKVMTQGQPPVDNLQWSINPAMLLLAQLNGKVNGSLKNQNIVGNFNVSAFGTLSASDVRARISAPVMQELMQMPLGELDGIFNINIEKLEMQQTGLPFINANLKWKNAKLTMLETVDLGFVDLSITTNDNDQLIAIISNNKGQLQIDGNAGLDNKKAYNLNLRLTPEKNATNNIRQSLAMFARRQSDGSYLVNRKGNLSDLGL